MSSIKGLVILTRFDYIERNFGREQLLDFIDQLNVEDKSQLIQPIIISKDYPGTILSAIDEKLAAEFFDHDDRKFMDLGRWNAQHLLPRYSQLYIDTRNPAGFLNQMANLRSIFVGPGKMEVSPLDAKAYQIHIDYGITYLESVRLSELGLLEEGCRMCGATAVESKALRTDGVVADYIISWK